MDRSLDSIGSCSLDVDADSSDISDTSGSLNFPTPLSIKDITREFTANIRERCSTAVVHTITQPQSSIAYLQEPTGQVRIVLNELNTRNIVDTTKDLKQLPSMQQPPQEPPVIKAPTVTTPTAPSGSYDKKPSYLNLACCVNGYSNLTTYDSKIRQDINKSREVSPIRPSASSIQYCKKNNSLAAPVLHAMPNVGIKVPKMPQPLTKQPSSSNKCSNSDNKTQKMSKPNRNSHNGSAIIDDQTPTNGSIAKNEHSTSDGNRRSKATSFIQQRVERLYGPGALAQSFYSPKTHATTSQRPPVAQKTAEAQEYVEKYHQLSPSKDYSEFRKKLDLNTTARQCDERAPVATNGDVDPPVFRHLSQEFRSQLPTVSPKRSVPARPQSPVPMNGNGAQMKRQNDVVDHAVPPEHYKTVSKVTSNSSLNVKKADHDHIEAEPVVKTGEYFLQVLKVEQARLLDMAAQVEKYIEILTHHPGINEDTMGLLRAAAGKARLLVTQKMKQFEGLCHNNLNRSPEDKFPTTVDDLQGFWDMVNLQVEQVDTIFADIEKMKNNNWKKTIDETVPKHNNNATKSQKTIKTGNNLKTRTTYTAGGNSSQATSAAALKREAQRKQFLEIKRKQREALAATKEGNSDDITTIEETTIIVADETS